MKLKVLITLLIVSVLFVVFFYACRTQKLAVVQTIPTVEQSPIITTLANPLKIATFNIQNFGKSKLSKSDIMDTLVTIIRTFDIVAVQEVSDVSNKTAGLFLELINRNQVVKYAMVCSERSGRQEND